MYPNPLYVEQLARDKERELRPYFTRRSADRPAGRRPLWALGFLILISAGWLIQ